MELPRADREELYRTLLALEHHRDGPRRLRHRGRHGGRSSTRSSSRTWTSTSSRRSSTTCRWRSSKHYPDTSPRSAASRPPTQHRYDRKDTTMGIFSRLGTLIKSNLNDLISQGGRPAEDAEPDRARHAEPAGRGEEAGRDLDRRREAAEEAVGRADRAVQGVGAQGDAGGAQRRRRPGQGGAVAARPSTITSRPSSASSGSCRRTPSTS